MHLSGLDFLALSLTVYLKEKFNKKVFSKRIEKNTNTLSIFYQNTLFEIKIDEEMRYLLSFYYLPYAVQAKLE